MHRQPGASRRPPNQQLGQQAFTGECVLALRFGFGRRSVSRAVVEFDEWDETVGPSAFVPGSDSSVYVADYARNALKRFDRN